MGIFGEDNQQNQRIAALENHVRVLTETVQANQVDLVSGWIAILALQAQIDQKVSAAEVDPTVAALNQQLGEARKELEEASSAASESWTTLQDGLRQSFETLRSSVHQAVDRIQPG